jgi:hypothetical protein
MKQRCRWQSRSCLNYLAAGPTVQDSTDVPALFHRTVQALYVGWRNYSVPRGLIYLRGGAKEGAGAFTSSQPYVQIL